MIYLVLKIGFYLLAAMGAGAAAGWLLRNLNANQKEQESARQIVELQSKVPQFETLLRTRDDNIAELKSQLKDKQQQLEQAQAAPDFEQERAGLLKKIARLEENVEELSAAQPLADFDFAGEDGAKPAIDPEVAQALHDKDAFIRELHQQIAQLQLQVPTGDENKVDDARVDELERTVKELEARLIRKAAEFDRIERELSREKARVAELERERELQNKSLQVMHQQLQMERERPTSSHG